MDAIIQAAVADAAPQEWSAIPMPESYRALTIHKDEVGIFGGIPADQRKSPRESLHVDEISVPELDPSEAIVAVMASSINYNTVWPSIFEPLPTFEFLEREFLERCGAGSPLARRGRRHPTLSRARYAGGYDRFHAAV
jgi:crotonyl-CoA reductase